MISWQRNTEISKEAIDDFRDKYKAYVGDRWEKIISGRDWEYVVVLNHLTPFMPNEVIVDIGGACCDLWFFLSPDVKRIYVVDDCSSSAQWFEQWYHGLLEKRDFRLGKIVIRRQNARLLPFSNNSIDKVVSISALEHFADGDDTKCAKETYRILKPGGIFIGTVDFNHLNEHPITPGGMERAYTVESFMRRIVEPSGFECDMPDMSGFANVSDKNYIAAMFFKLVKE